MQDYELAFQISIKLRAIGKTIQAIDILTASMSINRNFELVTKDTDYENIKLVEPKFKLILRK